MCLSDASLLIKHAGIKEHAAVTRSSSLSNFSFIFLLYFFHMMILEYYDAVLVWK